MRRPFVCGNWKMNQSLTLTRDFFTALGRESVPSHVQLGIAPVALHVTTAVAATNDQTVEIGVQDCHASESGAHTGDLSAVMARESGATFAIVGHSERRQNHKETSEVVAAKARAAQAAGLTAIVCVGETLAERQANQTLDIVSAQVNGSLDGVDRSQVVIAYEPVWAIGTGEVATPEQAQEVHAAIRQQLGADRANIRILYGGSVKPANASELLSCEDIDGALVGGASLDATSFAAIARAAPASAEA